MYKSPIKILEHHGSPKLPQRKDMYAKKYRKTSQSKDIRYTQERCHMVNPKPWNFGRLSLLLRL